MSDDVLRGSAAGPAGEGSATETKLYGASGEPLRTGSQSGRSQGDQLAAFVQEQPITAALVALVVGYFLGKIT